MSPAVHEPEPDAGRRDAKVAVKNAFTLGASLVATWAVALVVRFFLPRHLGPEAFGVYNFADAFSATFFVILGLGLETYIRKVIPVRPDHASDFFGGLLAVRLLLAVGVLVAMAIVMTLAGRPPSVQRVVFVFGAAQMLVAINGNLAALLHASRAVGGLAFVNVASKVLWGGGVALAIVAKTGLVGLALAFLASETLRAVALSWLSYRHVGLRLRLDLRALKAVLAASLPFYVIQVANTVYGRVDVSMLSVLASDTEIGWYGTSSNLAGLAFLLSPLVNWVLMPLLSRAGARSEEEMFGLVRRSIEAILLAILPISLLMGVGADVWIPLLFGRAFVPATLSLRILAPIFVFTYLAMISATILMLRERAWTVAAIQILGLALNPTLNFFLVPWAAQRLGVGGAGAGAAAALLITEASVATCLTFTVGRRAFDRAGVRAIGKAILSCAAVVIADRALRSLGPARLVLDMILYAALVFGTGAVKARDVASLGRLVLERRRQEAAA
ncbi:MAG: flippase [Polyangiaceae bacterium]